MKRSRNFESAALMKEKEMESVPEQRIKIEDSVIAEGTRIHNDCHIVHSRIGKGCAIGSHSDVLYTAMDEYSKLNTRCYAHCSKIGCCSYVMRNSTIVDAEIGKYSPISWNVSIGGGSVDHNMLAVSMNSLVHMRRQFFGIPKEETDFFDGGRYLTVVGNDVWIASGANIIQGVHVGDGAVIGAGSVVIRDVPPYSVVVGNPGRVVKYRFPQRIIERLLTLQWWDWPVEIVQNRIEMLTRDLTEEVLEELEQIGREIAVTGQ